MIILGKKNFKKLMDDLIIPNVAVKAVQYWFLPIYKVEITYDE